MAMLQGGRPGQSRVTTSLGKVRVLAFVVIVAAPLVAAALSSGPVGADSHLPDFVVAWFAVGEDTNGHVLEAHLRNHGSTISQAFSVRIVLEGVVNETVRSTGEFQSGGARSVTLDLNDWYPGEWTWAVTVDADAEVAESDESNNHRSESLMIATGPDIVLDDIRVVGSDGGNVVRATVTNVGKPFHQFVSSVVGAPGYGEEVRGVYGLGTGETLVVDLPLHTWVPSPLEVDVRLDRSAAVRETNEANNVRNVSLSVTEGPDLFIDNITVLDERIVLNEPIEVRLQLRNAGTHNSSYVPVDVSFAGTNESAGTSAPVSTGASVNATAKIWTRSIGHHQLRVVIDSDFPGRDVTRTGPDTYHQPIQVHAPSRLILERVDVYNHTIVREGQRFNQVRFEAEVTGDHVPGQVTAELHQGDSLVKSHARMIAGVGSDPSNLQSMSYLDGPDTYRTSIWRTDEFPWSPAQGEWRVAISFDNGTAWEVTGEGDTAVLGVVVNPPPQEEQRTPPTPPERYPEPVRGESVEPERVEPTQEKPAEDALPVELKVRHVNTWTDDEHPGAHMLRFEVDGLGPGGTSTDLGIVAKVGWQVEVLTSSQDIGEGDTATYDVRLTPPREGRTSSTITVGAWGEAARAEPITVNVRNLQAAGTAAGHPVPVWGYASGAAVLAAAAGAFVWFAEPRRYGFLRYLLAMFPVVGGFSRIQGEKVLEHEARERIHQVIENQPGVHYRALLRELGMSNGRLAHHLQTLEREGIIRTEAVAGRLHFYVTGSNAIRGTPLTDRQRALLAMIKKEPGILQSRLADRLGVSRQALHQHLDGLREQNLLIDARFGRTKALYLESDADQRLTVCGSCQSFYDRGQGLTAGVVCPGCGQGV